MLFEKTYGIDLGSSSVKVYSFFRNKTYIEKNMIASKGHTIIAMGNEAYDMFEKSPTDITVTSPMTFGMIANLELQEIVLYSMIRKIDHILGFGATMYFTVPLDMTAVEKRAYFHVANGHWLKKNRVFMVEAPIADAIAMGVDGVENMTQEEYRKAAVVAVKKLSADVGIPADLKEILKPEDVDFLSQSAMDDACRPGNPKDPSFEDIKNLYLSLM